MWPSEATSIGAGGADLLMDAAVASWRTVRHRASDERGGLDGLIWWQGMIEALSATRVFSFGDAGLAGGTANIVSGHVTAMPN